MAGDFQPDSTSVTRARLGHAIRAEIPNPVVAALGDPAVLRQLRNAATAMLRSRNRNLPARQCGTEAEDVVQEAARRALARQTVYDRERSVVPWLVGFVATVCKEKTRWRKTDAHIDEAETSLEEIVVDLTRPVEETLAERLDSRQILERLPPADRDLLRWRFFEDASALEIGKRLGISEAAARVRLYRVLTKLKQEMAYREEEQL